VGSSKIGRPFSQMPIKDELSKYAAAEQGLRQKGKTWWFVSAEEEKCAELLATIAALKGGAESSTTTIQKTPAKLKRKGESRHPWRRRKRPKNKEAKPSESIRTAGNAREHVMRWLPERKEKKEIASRVRRKGYQECGWPREKTLLGDGKEKHRKGGRLRMKNKCGGNGETTPETVRVS